MIQLKNPLLPCSKIQAVVLVAHISGTMLQVEWSRFHFTKEIVLRVTCYSSEWCIFLHESLYLRFSVYEKALSETCHELCAGQLRLQRCKYLAILINVKREIFARFIHQHEMGVISALIQVIERGEREGGWGLRHGGNDSVSKRSCLVWAMRKELCHSFYQATISVILRRRRRGKIWINAGYLDTKDVHIRCTYYIIHSNCSKF